MASKISVNPEQVLEASKSFVAPIELTGSRPRDVQLSAAGRFVYGMAVLLLCGALAGGVFLSRASLGQSERRDLLDQSGVVTTGDVTRLWRTSDDSRQPWAAYRFDAGGVAREGRSKIRLSRWRALQVGSAIDVRYVPGHPEINAIAGSNLDVIPVFVPFLLAAFLTTGGALILWSINCQRRLLADGRPAAAIVTDVVTHRTTHGGSHRSIKYTFQLLSGAMAKGKSDASRKSPAIGSVICVVYDPDRPRRSRRYPFPLVKTARL